MNTFVQAYDCWDCYMRKKAVPPELYQTLIVPVMAAVAVRKKVVSIDHFSPSFYLQSLQIFFSIRLNQEQLYVLIALKIRGKWD